MPDLIATRSVRVRPASQLAHLLLHCEPHDAAGIAERLSLALPATMLDSGAGGGWSALHLAPDEWLLLGSEADAARLTSAFEQAGATWPLSLVDISDRSLAYEIEGADAETLLAAGCPMDLAPHAFGTGRCTRTLFGKAMVMLWRTAPQTFRLEVARSFAPYVVELLSVAAREFA